MLFNVSPRTRHKLPSQTEHPTFSLQNAGISLPETPIEDLPIEKFLSVMSINVCTKYATRLMKSQEPKGGRIINNGR
jgi:NAD(P)-dependent dehydrogenase (short-subunit alcohol dehydrogenase family)